jgi:hypothetical protein
MAFWTMVVLLVGYFQYERMSRSSSRAFSFNLFEGLCLQKYKDMPIHVANPLLRFET